MFRTGTGTSRGRRGASLLRDPSISPATTASSLAQQYGHTGSCKAVDTLMSQHRAPATQHQLRDLCWLPSTWTTTSLSFSTFMSSIIGRPRDTRSRMLVPGYAVLFQAQVDLARRRLCASGSLVLDNIVIRRVLPNNDGGDDGRPPLPGPWSLPPTGTVLLDRHQRRRCHRRWWSFGDYYAAGEAIPGAETPQRWLHGLGALRRSPRPRRGCPSL